jgi:hypothetical protein
MPKLSDAVRSGKLIGNLQAQECPSRNILKHVTGRWAVLTLIALQGRTIRFAALRRTIGGVSDRMLTPNASDIGSGRLRASAGLQGRSAPC